MLRILLAAAELETVPEEIAGHPQVRKAAKALGKRPTDLLLDQNQFAQACKRLEEGARRGRPDLVQYTLLNLLESPLCKAGGLEVAVHTRHGHLLRIRSDTRLPRGEQRFQGLLAKVLRDGASQDKDPLLWAEGPYSPAETLQAFAQGKVVRLDPQGTRLDVRALPAHTGAVATIVLGGFAHGGFPEAWTQAVPEAVSIWDAELNVWAVAAELAAAYRA